MKTIVIGVIALLISGCTTISYEKTVTTYSDRTVESTKVTSGGFSVGFWNPSV